MINMVLAAGEWIPISCLTSTTKYSTVTLSSGIMNQTSELVLMSVTLLVVGTYVCQAISGATTENSSAILTVLSEFTINVLCSLLNVVKFLQKSAMKAVSGWLVVNLRELGLWRCVRMEYGDQSAVTSGSYLMLL